MKGNENVQSLNEAAIGVHEIFLSYLKAGFTRPEALEIVKEHMRLAQADKAKEEE